MSDGILDRTGRSVACRILQIDAAAGRVIHAGIGIARKVIRRRTDQRILASPLIVHAVRVQYLLLVGLAVAVDIGSEIAVHDSAAGDFYGIGRRIGRSDPYMPAPNDIACGIACCNDSIARRNGVGLFLIVLIFALGLFDIERGNAILERKVLYQIIGALPQQLDALGLQRLAARAAPERIEQITRIGLGGDIAVRRCLAVVDIGILQYGDIYADRLRSARGSISDQRNFTLGSFVVVERRRRRNGNRALIEVYVVDTPAVGIRHHTDRSDVVREERGRTGLSRRRKKYAARRNDELLDFGLLARDGRSKRHYDDYGTQNILHISEINFFHKLQYLGKDTKIELKNLLAFTLFALGTILV